MPAGRATAAAWMHGYAHEGRRRCLQILRGRGIVDSELERSCAGHVLASTAMPPWILHMPSSAPFRVLRVPLGGVR